MRNQVRFPADIVPMSVSYTGGVTAGQGVLMGSLFGVAQADAAQNATVDCCVVGEFVLPKASGAISAGARVFWDNTARNITTTATGNHCVGVATVQAASGDATVRVLLGPRTASGA